MVNLQGLDYNLFDLNLDKYCYYLDIRMEKINLRSQNLRIKSYNL